MSLTLLLTGATDGIGLETVKALLARGNHVLLHGRNAEKMERVIGQLSEQGHSERVDGYLADLSVLDEVFALAEAVKGQYDHIDVLINNAGVFKTSRPLLSNGMDVRFVVNTIAPYILTTQLLPLMSTDGRVVNLSSAAQATVDIEALQGQHSLNDDFDAYAQSKRAITQWTRYLAEQHPDGPELYAVNPGSLLGTKMVQEGFGLQGKDIGIGSDILLRASLADEFVGHSGEYFDNDSGRFMGKPEENPALMQVLDGFLSSVN